MKNDDLILSVSDFVAVFNQTLEYAYPNIVIVGELANFKISKNRWVYFDLKDELASIKFFGTVYMIPGPLEDGMMLQVRGVPRLHPLYGFSVNVTSIQPVGEGSLKRASQLLETKLRAEGLFEPERKRKVPYPPQTVGLITSAESAAYHDFIKVVKQRWGGLEISLADVQVQGEASPGQITAAVNYFNQHSKPPEVLVITRGGGSAEDLASFNNELVTRAVAASRIPTVVAAGHEINISLAELVADVHASTPSNAAELLVPDKRHENERLNTEKLSLGRQLNSLISEMQLGVERQLNQLKTSMTHQYKQAGLNLLNKRDILVALNPDNILKRGYAILRLGNKVIRSGKQISSGQIFSAQISDASIKARADEIILQ